jgi:hypothetical protein
MNGFIDAGSNPEIQTPIRSLLKKLMQSGLTEDLQKVVTAGVVSHSQLNAESLHGIPNASPFASLWDNPKGS